MQSKLNVSKEKENNNHIIQDETYNPKLRFPKFNDLWNEKSLNNFLSFKNGFNASKENYGSGIKFINVSDILENNYLNYNNISDSVEVSEENIKNYLVEYGDILFQRSSENREEVGTANVYLDTKPCIFGGFVIRGKKIKEYNPFFLKELLNSETVRKEITSWSGGSTRYNIGQESLNKISIIIPEINEQNKIADFLMNIDKKIILMQKKHKNVEKIKEYYLNELFNFNKQDINNNLLGDLCTIQTGKLDANAMVEDGTYHFYTCAKEHYYINQYAFDTEALLISGNGAHVGYIHYYKGKFNAYQRTYVLNEFVDKIKIKYIKYYLEKNLHKQIWREKKEGNTPYIVLSTLKNFEIEYPSLEKQELIINLLINLDKQIELYEKSLLNLKKFKKALLQKMFV